MERFPKSPPPQALRRYIENAPDRRYPWRLRGGPIDLAPFEELRIKCLEICWQDEPTIRHSQALRAR